MAGFPSPLGGDDGESQFDDYDEFVPENVPDPGPFLDGHDVLTGDDHLAFHRVTKELFEERGVYDMTFGYNLARLNLDPRHRNAGYRYAVEDPDARSREDGEFAAAAGPDVEDPAILRAEFTPTTPFCPQSDTLTKGSFRAWNGLSERHGYDLVRVRVDDMHHRSDEINDALAELEAQYCESGTVTHVSEHGRDDGRDGTRGESGCSQGSGGTTSRGYGPEAPF